MFWLEQLRINYILALGTDSARVYSTTSERPDGPMITRVVREDRTYCVGRDFSGGGCTAVPIDYVTGLGRFDIFGLSFQVAIRNALSLF